MDKNLIWIIRGSQRKSLFLSLPENPFLSNKLRKYLNEKKSFNLSLREVSRHLRNFEKKGLIGCANKKDPYNKIYKLTFRGKKLKKEVLKLIL